MKKIFCILLVLIMVLFAFTGCGKDNNSSGKSKDDTSADVETSKDDTSEEDESSQWNEDEYLDFILQDEFVSYSETPKKDLNGREIFIVERWFGYGKPIVDFTGEVLYMETDDGTLDRVNTAKKNIIEQIQKDYNCKINGEIFGAGSSDIISDLKYKITVDVEAGTNKYDFFFESPYYYTSFVSEGKLKDIKEIPTINLNSSCWDQNAVKELSICNSLYFVLGDINTYDNNGTVAMIFNKDLYKKLGYTEDLYQLVKDYQWTFDKLVELSSSFLNI